MSGVAVVAMALSGVAEVDVALPGVAAVDVALPGVAWCCCGDHDVAVVTMVLLW